MGNIVKVQDLVDYIPDIGEYTIPETRTVETKILGVETQMEAIAKSYGAPTPFVEGSEDFKLVKPIIASEAAYQCYNIKVVDTETRPAVVSWHQKWLDFLKNLKEGMIKFPSTITEETKPPGGITSSPLRRA
jgi:hypothetical protein